jgi:hypothetical protein
MLLLVGGGGAYLLRRPLLSRMGRALVVADPLEKADAAVVCAGPPMSQDHQLHTAARLYRDGGVRKLVLSGPRGPYGIYETEFSFPLAISLGIPQADILAVPNTTRFIDQEAELLVAVLAGRGSERFTWSPRTISRGGRGVSFGMPRVGGCGCSYTQPQTIGLIQTPGGTRGKAVRFF